MGHWGITVRLGIGAILEWALKRATAQSAWPLLGLCLVSVSPTIAAIYVVDAAKGYKEEADRLWTFSLKNIELHKTRSGRE